MGKADVGKKIVQENVCAYFFYLYWSRIRLNPISMCAIENMDHMTNSAIVIYLPLIKILPYKGFLYGAYYSKFSA